MIFIIIIINILHRDVIKTSFFCKGRIRKINQLFYFVYQFHYSKIQYLLEFHFCQQKIYQSSLYYIFKARKSMISSNPVTTPRQRVLQKFIKQEKTTSVEYSIIQSLLAYLQTNPDQFCTEFFQLYCNVLPQMRRLTLFQYLNFQLWNDTDMPRQLRDKTEFFSIVSEWIIGYEMKLEDMKSLKDQIIFLREFIEKQTKNMFQRVVLFEEIYEDLVSLFGRKFWGDLADLNDSSQEQKQEEYNENSCKQIQKVEKGEIKIKEIGKQIKNNQIQRRITKDQAQELIKLISSITSYFVIYVQKMGYYINCSLNLISQNHSEKYKIFMQTAIKNVLLVNQRMKEGQNAKNAQNLDSSQQQQITRIALIFLQRPDIDDNVVIEIVKLMMLKTSKMVRYAMIVDYVRFYEYLERTGRDAVLQQLEQIVYFRELIIGRNQVQEAGLLVHTLGPTFQQITIAAGACQRLMFSHQQVYGQHSLLQIQVQIQGGDITMIIHHFNEGKEQVYWREDRTQDRRIDIILQKQGLYTIEFDNSYSWLKGKKVLYKIQQFGRCP